MPQEMKETVLVLDFGGQYNQLIARRVREQECIRWSSPTAPLSKRSVRPGIRESFSPAAQTACMTKNPPATKGNPRSGVPVLGICYGAQLMAYLLGGRVTGADEDPGCASEYGATRVRLTDPDSLLFRGLDPNRIVS